MLHQMLMLEVVTFLHYRTCIYYLSWSINYFPSSSISNVYSVSLFPPLGCGTSHLLSTGLFNQIRAAVLIAVIRNKVSLPFDLWCFLYYFVEHVLTKKIDFLSPWWPCMVACKTHFSPAKSSHLMIKTYVWIKMTNSPTHGAERGWWKGVPEV